MLTVTERAATALETLLTQSDAEPGHGVKLIPRGPDDIALTIEAPSVGDEVIRRANEPLLIVDSALTQPLDGAELDCDDAVDGQTAPRFALRRPPDA